VETKSTHKVEIVPVSMTKHPNADSLSIIPVWGYSYVGRTADWEGVERAAYIPPDSVVDATRPEFSFLVEQAKADGKVRIKAKKLRGIVSYGLMVPVPADTPLGEDWAERLGVTHYEPEINEGRSGEKFFTGGEVAAAPSVYTQKYDVDAFLRYHHLFVPGEPVVVTEKLDGANSRYVYIDGKMNAGSRTEWKKEYPSYDHVTVEGLVAKGMPEDKAKEAIERLHSKPKRKNLWWEVLERTPALEKFCRDNPGLVVYGEVFGNVNAIKYGFEDGHNRFAAFDIMKDGKWLSYEEAFSKLAGAGVPVAPIVAWPIGYDFELIKAKAEGATLVDGAKPGTIREGIVVKPLQERYDPHVGRVCFKVVSPVFLEKYR